MIALPPQRTLTEDLLARAAEDWVSAAEVMDLVRRSEMTDPSNLRDLGLVVAGDIVGSKHVPWSITAGEAILQISSDWAAETNPFVMPGSIMWLDTTPRGQSMGKAVWKRENECPS